MEFSLMPKSPRTAIVLVVVLVGAVLFVVTSGGKSRQARGRGHRAAQTLADLAVPGPDASAPQLPASTAGADTTFGESPFLSVEAGGLERDPGEEGAEPGAPFAEEGGIRALVASTVPQRLLGTIVDSDQRMALIDGKYYSVGQFVGGWQLATVERGEARLERRGQSITLKVGT